MRPNLVAQTLLTRGPAVGSYLNAKHADRADGSHRGADYQRERRRRSRNRSVTTITSRRSWRAIDADLLMLLTDQAGLYGHRGVTRCDVIKEVPVILTRSWPGRRWDDTGTGGMTARFRPPGSRPIRRYRDGPGAAENALVRAVAGGGGDGFRRAAPDSRAANAGSLTRRSGGRARRRLASTALKRRRSLLPAGGGRGALRSRRQREHVGPEGKTLGQCRHYARAT